MDNDYETEFENDDSENEDSHNELAKFKQLESENFKRLLNEENKLKNHFFSL